MLAAYHIHKTNPGFIDSAVRRHGGGVITRKGVTPFVYKDLVNLCWIQKLEMSGAQPIIYYNIKDVML
jgi:hypothetical protein